LETTRLGVQERVFLVVIDLAELCGSMLPLVYGMRRSRVIPDIHVFLQCWATSILWN